MPPLIPAPQPIAAPPGNASMPDTSQPDISSFQTKKPQVFKAPTAQDKIGQHLQSRLETDYQKDADPYGSPDNHPGVFGKILHGLNVATGGVNRRGWEEQGLEQRLNSLASENAKNDYQNAEAEHTRAETPEVGPNAESLRKEQGAQTENLESEARDRDANTANGPSLAMAYAHAVNQAIKNGVDPAQDPIVQHLQDAITGIQRQPVDKSGEAPKTIQIEQSGKPHQMAWDAKTGKYDLDQGESGEKPPSIHVETPGEQRGAKNDILKAYTPTLESGERMNVMTDAYEKAIKDHDQQAMLNLLANHLGMTMGLQKGARMTKDIIHEAQQSRPWLQGLQATFDKDGYLSGVTLSPDQMRKMVNLAQQRYSEDAKKSRSTAQYLGATDDGPERIPGKATINYYLGVANGDPNKAKQLAKEDGWTVK